MINLRFDHVSKRYRIYREPENGKVDRSILRKLRAWWGGSTDFWALRDVSFAVQRGEALGIIGQNGAGKSTILKLLYNITTPTLGEITIRGRLSALIEIASGFHPELTGRENIYLNGSLLGMRRSEITQKLDSIVEFAGVAPFIDTPVKRYSSGMYLRLGFAIAAHLDPDILLLDEVLAVGDAAFQAKCIERILELKRAGNTIVFVSHALAAVERLCDRVLLLRQGEVVTIGPPREVIGEYERLLLSLPASAPNQLTNVDPNSAAEILSVMLLNSEGQKTSMFSTGDQLRTEVQYLVHKPIKNAVIEVYFYSMWANLHTHFSTERDGEGMDLEPGPAVIEFFWPEIGLEEASYNVEASIKPAGASLGEQHIDYKHGAVINIRRGKPTHGFFHTAHTWRMKKATDDSYLQPLDTVVEDVV